MSTADRSGQSHRLLVNRERWERLRRIPSLPLLQQAAAALDELAEAHIRDRDIPVDETGFNWHLGRAQQLQSRVISLLTQYGRTQDRRFREAAMDYVRVMAGWKEWSWTTWRQGDADTIFDLPYGENSLTLALVLDWLAEELSPEERTLLVNTARERCLLPYLAVNGTPGEESWYFRCPNSNWNTVCSGGAGALALALGDACEESARVLALVEESVRQYFEHMEDDGAWPEGIGYWNYGHRYGYYYLLSHEGAERRPHPLLELPGSRATLRFPLLFSPNGTPASFGDANHFFPAPFHYAAAERYQLGDVIAELDRRFLRMGERGDLTSTNRRLRACAAELLLFHPGESAAEIAETPWPRVSVQRGVEWSYLADRWPHPRLYASVRGGSTEAPHTHQDLLSLFVVVGDEALIHSVGVDEYVDTTFGRRRYELYEISAAAKNVPLINGVGLPHPGRVKTTTVSGDGWEGMALDATETQWVGTPVEAFVRSVLMLGGGAAILVLDRAVLRDPALAEARFHTFHHLRRGRASADIRGDRESLHLSFAASVPAALKTGRGLPTQPAREPDSILRWVTLGKHREIVLATLLTPNGRGRVRVSTRTGAIRATGPGFDITVAYPQ